MATVTERLLLILDSDAKGATRGLDQVTDSAKKADKSFTDLNKKSSNLGSSIKSGLAIGAGAVIGGGLADAVINIGRDFLEAAKGVEMFANATNSTIEESSRFMGMAKAMGLDVNDLLEIVAEFGPKAEAMKDELAGVGIELQKNADGSINVGRSLENALEGLQQIPDDAERMQMAMKLFGEEGSKQLAAIYNGTKPVSEALEDLDLGIDAGDIAKARAFNEAMTDLKGAGRDLGFSLASVVLPAITGVAQALGPIADLIGQIRPEVLLLGGGFLALSRYGGGLASFLSGAATGFRNLGDNMKYQQALAKGAGENIGRVRGAMLGLKDSAGAAVNSISPMGAAMGTALVGFQFFGSAVEAMKADVEGAVPKVKELEDAGVSAGQAYEQTAKELDKSASFMSRLGAEAAGADWVDLLAGPVAGSVIPALNEGGDSAKEFADQLRETTEAMGPAAVAAGEFALKQKTLNDLIAEGVSVNSGQYADAVRDAAAAQVENKANTDQATASIEAYIAATTGAVDATLASIDSTYAQSDAFRNAQTAIADAAKATDDTKTVADEAAAAQDSAAQAALRYAAASLQAAQDQAALRGEVLSASQAADVQILALQQMAAQPGISPETRANIQAMIDQLTEAKEKGDAGVNVKVGETGTAETKGEIDEASGDRETAIRVESRNGPAVIAYLDGIASKRREALIRIETRNGPAVIAYLDRIDNERLALIRVESRNGPAVISYLDSIASERLAIIRVESRNGPAVDSYLDSLASQSRTATLSVRQVGAAATAAPTAAPMALLGATNMAAPMVYPVSSGGRAASAVTVNYSITNKIATGTNPVEVGRATVDAIRAFERSAGATWRRSA